MANTPLTCTATCPNCMKSGLAILPVRYAVVPKTMSNAMPPGIVGPGVMDIALTAHHYSLRTLREGWLYLFYEKGARGSNYWEAYRVTEDGRLWKQTIPVPSVPKTDPACAQGGGAVPMDVISIEKPEKATRVFIAFSEYPWIKEVFQKYATDAKLRGERMQVIMPASWIQSGSGMFGMKKGEAGHATVATQAGIDQIVEYQPGLKADLLAPPAKPIAIDEYGRATDDTIWEQEATRYPLYIRQTSPSGSASTDLVKLMNEIGENAGGPPHKPMLLALWDGIGIAHELAGFHNDPAGMLMRYTSMQPLRVDAVQSIEAAERAVRSGAALSESLLRKGMMSAALGAGDGGIMAPSALEMIDNAGQLTPAEKQAAGDKAWRKYQASLKGGKWPNSFSTWFDKITSKCEELQKQRVPDRDAWLSSDAFRHALNDYHPDDAGDGMAFHGVIDEAYAGLSATNAGLRIVEKLINNMDPTDERSYFWRAFAYNQMDIRQEMRTFLTRVQATKSESIVDQAASWYETKQASFYVDLSYLKSFVKFYEKVEDIFKHERAGSATERPLKALGIERLTLWSGRALINVFGPISRSVGGMLIKGALMVRGGLVLEDAKRIVVKLAAWEGQMDAAMSKAIWDIKAKNPSLNPMQIRAQAYVTLANDDRGALVRKLYAEARLTPNASRDKAAASVKLSGALFIIEMMNYFLLWTKPNKTATDELAIASGTLSLVGAGLNTYNKWLGGFGKSAASATLASMKVTASCLSGISSFISVTTDAMKVASGLTSGNYKQASFYFIKGIFDLGSGVATVLTAISSSAALLMRSGSLSPGKIRFVGRLSAGIAGAQARIEGRAANVAAEKMEAYVANAVLKGTRAYAGETVAMGLAAEVSAGGWLMFSGRMILIATGWEVAVVLTVITLVYNYFTPDDLENWLSSSPFGTAPDKARTLEKQQAAFESALAATGN
ncbi:T6SS effector BTH_I2691 family protein [Burkholderia vietnamiensis]|uniref:T6SS effector BTH_I2691 family protein n=1 Tax=Burkholderia vietnamiensis TaxID=60552 RepID=UPI000A866005|nr:T6SS effector BTH_I2691 family protein [Burkholderia vietnamiensis]